MSGTADDATKAAYAMDKNQDSLLGSKSGAGRPKSFASFEAGFEDTEAHGPEEYDSHQEKQGPVGDQPEEHERSHWHYEG